MYCTSGSAKRWTENTELNQHLFSCVTLLLSPAAELQSVLEPFLLRRVKSEVAVDLPKKTELLMYHGMSALQKKYYKAILMKDLGKTLYILNPDRMLQSLQIK